MSERRPGARLIPSPLPGGQFHLKAPVAASEPSVANRDPAIVAGALLGQGIRERTVYLLEPVQILPVLGPVSQPLHGHQVT
jgi:hypothetical protein